MEFILSDQNIPFSIAITLMLIISLLEGVLTLVGFGASQALDSILPDVDVDAGSSITTGGALSRFLGWIRFGKVPALVLLVVFLSVFGVIGITMQAILDETFGFMLPAFAAGIISLLLSLPIVRSSSGILSKIAFKDETESISSSSFIGRVATITLGEAKQNSPAEARFKDQFGTTHYIMVEPIEQTSFSKGEKVLLVESNGAVFKVIAPNNPNLNHMAD
ncbi:hypothetical protein NBRC116188_06490 [Oceaniserpentilla sp. 4NH20-0058]|uniref:YqiJ family protein n=1 Tax=Oceaniserpentilla sp. 4NH20-0058 TaxID=3127660 RepID=UPI003105B0C8